MQVGEICESIWVTSRFAESWVYHSVKGESTEQELVLYVRIDLINSREWEIVKNIKIHRKKKTIVLSSHGWC